MEKMKLIFLKKGEDEDRVIFGVEKSELFTTLFPNFLLNCRLTNNDFFDDDFSVESMGTYYHLFNNEYEMSIFVGKTEIFVEIRAWMIGKVIEGILNMASFERSQ